jgi:transketolase
MIKSIRRSIIENSYKAKACHIGSALSCVEILVAIDQVKKPKDYFIFSKASGVSAYYSLLAEKGIIRKDKVADYLKNYPLASKEVKGIIHSVGSIGHGLNVAVGIAFANRKRKVYCLMSDGELNEGSTWEALLFAGHHRLDNLIVVIDNNGLQACGATKDILSLEPLEDKFKAFNCWTARTDGHNVKNLKKLLTAKSKNAKIVIGDTIKGKGVDFIENDYTWHYRNLDDQLTQRALKQLWI